jgi:hypothetical protein
MNTMYSEPTPRPVSLLKWPKTKPADWWWAGLMASTPTMISTPKMCHHTLTSFSSATSLMPNWFSSPCTTSTIAKISTVTEWAVLTPHCR